MGNGDSRHSFDRRNRLAYLALHYAIQGSAEQSEQIRELIWRLDGEAAKVDTSVLQDPVTA